MIHKTKSTKSSSSHKKTRDYTPCPNGSTCEQLVTTSRCPNYHTQLVDCKYGDKCKYKDACKYRHIKNTDVIEVVTAEANPVPDVVTTDANVETQDPIDAPAVEIDLPEVPVTKDNTIDCTTPEIVVPEIPEKQAEPAVTTSDEVVLPEIEKHTKHSERHKRSEHHNHKHNKHHKNHKFRTSYVKFKPFDNIKDKEFTLMMRVIGVN